MPTNGKKRLHKRGLLLFSAITLIEATFGQSLPDNQVIDPIVIPDDMVYSPGVYDVPKTSFDGVTQEQYVTYLKLDGNQSVTLPIEYSGRLDRQIDFTLMFWFKIDDDVISDKLMYLFQLGDALSCHLTKSDELICDSSKSCEKIIMNTSKLFSNQWYHFTFSSSSSGAAYVSISDNYRQIGQAETADFSMIQEEFNWEVTLGNCGSMYGFKGGFREFLVTNQFLSISDIQNVRNTIQEFDKSVLAYARFSTYNGMFDQDQFRQINMRFTGGSSSSMAQQDFISNDVCKPVLNLVQFAQIKPGTSPNIFKLSQTLEHSYYEYTMSITMMIDEMTCYESNPNRAADNCNIVHLDDVFMLYFEKINRARIHFFAMKNYFESTSPSFFIPQDQWITVQVALSRFDGYQIKIIDQNGSVFRQFNRMRNMRQMRPDNSIEILKNFDGRVDNFSLCTKRYQLPVDPYTLSPEDCPIIASFNSDSINQNLVTNEGSDQDLLLSNTPQMIWMNYQQPNLTGQSVASDSNDEKLFDGIACNDDHKYLRLKEKGQFSFDTPEMNSYIDSATIEFWFKLDDTVDAYQYLATMRAEGLEFDGFEIFLSEDLELVCAPFGQMSVKDPILVFENFNQNSTDEFGWFHVSCSYTYQGTVRATLSNTLFEEIQELSLGNNEKYYPRDSLKVRIGDPGQQDKVGARMFVKEVRYWTEARSTDQIFQWRRNQIDPDLQAPQALANYFRLASGDYNALDLGQFVPRTDGITINSRPELAGQLGIETEESTIDEFYIDTETGLKAIRKVPVYHTICPLYTYFLDNLCYSEPINKLILTILPVYNLLDDELQYLFSIENSSTLTKSVFENLNLKWETDDPVLQLGFVNKTQETEVRIVPSLLRQGGKYHVMVTATNERETFKQAAHIDFVPTSCRWLQEKDGAASGGMIDQMLSQGSSDISFELEIMQNPKLSCQDSFYDTFKDITFDEFIMQDTTEYIQDKPLLTWNYTNEQKTSINVTIPADQQYKMPIAKIVKIQMSAIWTSSQYDAVVSKDSYIMQNLEYSVFFAAIDNELVTIMDVNRPYAIVDDTVKFDASESYVTNLPASMSKDNLSYSWLCPEEFIEFCETQTKSTLTITYASFVNLVLPQFEEYYTFKVVINWIKQDGTIESGQATQEMIWYNVRYPVFDVTFDEPVLLSNNVTRFEMDPANFEDEDLSYFTINWEILPEIDLASQQVLFSGKMFQIISSSLVPRSEYYVSCQMIYKTLPEVKTERVVVFNTQSIPFGGQVNIQPESAFINEVLTIDVLGWQSDNPPVVYDVYETNDALGTIIGQKLTTSPIQQTFTYQYTATTANPIYIEITDGSKEVVKTTLFPTISPEPTPLPNNNGGSDNSTQSNDTTNTGGL